MGRLYDFYKNDLNKLKEFAELEKTDFLASRKFDTYKQHFMDYRRAENLIMVINNNAKTIFGSQKDFYDFIKDNKNLIPEEYSIPNVRVGMTNFLDYEAILNKIEEVIDNDKIDFIINTANEKINEIEGTTTHPFNDIINNMKKELNELNLAQNEMSEEERKELMESLDYANESLIIKGNDELDDIIDDISETRGLEATRHIREFAIKHNINPDDLEQCQSKEHMKALDLLPETNKNADTLRPILNMNLTLTDEFKNKMIALDQLISSKPIMKDLAAGESGKKEYAFIDWFNKGLELKNALLRNSTFNNNQRAEKIENYKNINRLSKELKEITHHYDDVIAFIKNNFDIDKISIPGNIYSGRMHKLVGDDINNYFPNLIDNFDNDNALYGVLLNGYNQVKGFCNEYNIDFVEFMNNSNKIYLDKYIEKRKEVDNKYMLPKETNSLGKRMAVLLVQPDRAYDTVSVMDYKTRAVDFFHIVPEMDENTFDNVIINNVATRNVVSMNHAANNLFFNFHDKERISLKNLFAQGERTDDLNSLSINYFDDNLNRNNNYTNYNLRIAEMKDTNPVRECNRVLKVLNDFLVERKNRFDHETELCGGPEGGLLYDGAEPALMFIAAKEYFEDYIYKNQIDLNSIRSSSDRKKVFDFIQNPVAAFAKKYPNGRNKFYESKEESYNKYVNEFQKNYAKDHKDDYHAFVEKFGQNNTKPRGYNTGKNISRILEDNKGGWFERTFRRTSKEYLALASSVNAATSRTSPTKGDLKGAKLYAQKYLDYKLPPGTNEENLSETSKRRVEFARSVLAAIDEVEVAKLGPKEDDNLIIDNNNNDIIQDKTKIIEFQDKIKADTKENLIIEENNIIETKEPDIELKN